MNIVWREFCVGQGPIFFVAPVAVVCHASTVILASTAAAHHENPHGVGMCELRLHPLQRPIEPRETQIIVIV